MRSPEYRLALWALLGWSACWGGQFDGAPLAEAEDEDAGAQVDAGEPDSELEDASEPDSELEDAGEPDSELEDAGEPDSEPVDAGEQLEDAGEPDSEPVDAGEPDTGPSCACSFALGADPETVAPCPQPCNCDDPCSGPRPWDSDASTAGAVCLTCNTFQPLVTCSVCQNGTTCQAGRCQ